MAWRGRKCRLATFRQPSARHPPRPPRLTEKPSPQLNTIQFLGFMCGSISVWLELHTRGFHHVHLPTRVGCPTGGRSDVLSGVSSIFLEHHYVQESACKGLSVYNYMCLA
ncbi:hypothetical protein B0I35DRAFT_137864 [Stachybotrys elegans]|uniref:Uncharacterized protein n=1 Tax=Stachybotrys elegans TaxID=80388 RepID=A0A8K0SZE5_9HYPO|nr:hypothetical protein B0I35DRAFT_137864 [Stachybotrys elegans]